MAGGHHAFSFAFGLRNECEDQADPVSHVRFRVLWDKAGEPGAPPLLDRSEEARGETAFTGAGTIPLSGQPGRLTFLTDPEAGPCRPTAWWSEFHVQP
jgi:hypothetical protein